MKTKNQPLIVIAGPTGVGKSQLAIDLAKKFNGYIINADSRQVYKELNIGTAKPVPDRILSPKCWEINGIPHYLYGHVSIRENYNLSDYVKEVREIIAQEKKIPFLVGGTGLYIDTIVYGFELADASEKSHKFEDKSVEELRILAGEKLSLLNQSDAYNPRRLIRLLQGGASYRVQSKRRVPAAKCLYLVLDQPEDTLNKHLADRIDLMFKQGLLEENETLRNKFPKKNLKAFQTIGYQEFDPYFAREKTLEEVKDLIYLHTKQYTRRQRTWFKRNKIAVLIPDNKKAIQLAENFLQSL
ncbi:tRNA (adenosine(37)-N6)-dimethylallyltransferase MiaA [Candidatus Dojkabacteria bacterium]|uniref:tRNA dimethylallyltransferase n=1 Tax=Candidatus Dojkabacteria bacterium TaxID=2099670 RepID=A0A955HYS6_9BACT|nr:tRNA (adenosine(37)-N6)-dimethylallyltransferase MiaA [Candidatus Dojkabacteria bacterium]